MLSAAHVLAMDAKNLLDVIDSLRLRYPELFKQQSTTPQQPDSGTRFQFDISSQQQPSSASIASPQSDDSYQIMTRQTYENMSQMQNQLPLQHTSPPNSLTQSYEQQSNDLYANQQSGGIYDNECVINQQMKSLEIDSKSNQPKPPVAVKPSNLQQKLKMNARIVGCAKTDHVEMEDTLKIVEDDLYSNTMSMCGGNSSLLPEPVPCSVVQENIFQKVKSSSKME